VPPSENHLVAPQHVGQIRYCSRKEEGLTRYFCSLLMGESKLTQVVPFVKPDTQLVGGFNPSEK